MKSTLVLISILFFFGCAPKKTTHYDTVIQNGNIIDLATGEMIQQDVFITDGTIVKVSPSGLSESFTSERKVDASGMYLLPGFWDNHVHFRGGDSLIPINKNFLNLFIANGVTTVRDAGGDLTKAVMEWKKEMEGGTLIGPTIFTSGPKIDGPNARWAGSLEVENAADISQALDSLERLKVDFVKIYDSRISGENYLKSIEAAEKRNLLTSGHMPFTVNLDQTVAAGIDAIEHLYYIMKGCSSKEKEITQELADGKIGFWTAMPSLMETYDEATARATFSNLKQHNVYVVPTLHIGETLSYLDEVDHSKDPYLKYMGKGIIATYQGRINGALNSSEEARKNRKELDAFFGRLAKSLDEAGVKLLAGSDSGAFNSYTYPGISLHKEMEAMVTSGLSPLHALRTSAYNGAHFFGKEGKYGTIADGKVADLVLLKGNPLKDITQTRNIAFVVQGNTVHDTEKLKHLLEIAVVQ